MPHGTPAMRQGSEGFNISLDKLILKEEAIEGEERKGGMAASSQKHMVRYARMGALGACSLSLLVARKSQSSSESREAGRF